MSRKMFGGGGVGHKKSILIFYQIVKRFLISQAGQEQVAYNTLDFSTGTQFSLDPVFLPRHEQKIPKSITETLTFFLLIQYSFPGMSRRFPSLSQKRSPSIISKTFNEKLRQISRQGKIYT